MEGNERPQTIASTPDSNEKGGHLPGNPAGFLLASTLHPVTPVAAYSFRLHPSKVFAESSCLQAPWNRQSHDGRRTSPHRRD